MKKVILFVLICLISLVSTSQAHADGHRYYGWGHRSVGVVAPIVVAATVVTAAAIIASHQQAPQPVMVVQPYYAPVVVPAGQPVYYVTQ